MKTRQIAIFLIVFGVIQVQATGFTYNMHTAQKLLNSKQETAYLFNVSDRPPLATSEKLIEPGDEKRVSERVVPLINQEEPIAEKVVGTLSQWLSSLLMKLLTFGFFR